jgi:hypothetical protein
MQITENQIPFTIQMLQALKEEIYTKDFHEQNVLVTKKKKKELKRKLCKCKICVLGFRQGC